MKRIVVRTQGEPDVLVLEDAPDPVPATDQVVVELRAIGVNPVETYVRSGKNGYTAKLPYTPGADGAGVVAAVGAGVTTFRVGDRVYVNAAIGGTYAEKALCNVTSVHPLPERASFEQGAAMGVPYGTAYRALFDRGEARPGETVLVHGASGGVGTAVVQLAAAHGIVAIGTASTDAGRKAVLEDGAAHALDHSSPSYLDELVKLTGGRGVDVVVEMLANVNLDKDLDVVAKHGRIVVVGSRGPVEINPRKGMSKDVDVRPMTLMNATPDDLRRIHAALGAGLANGSLRPRIARKFPLADAPAAHREVASSHAPGKIVLVP